MSNNIKLVIEIPESDYKAICENKEDAIIAHDTCRRIAKNGMPLDDVKVEIEAGIDPLDDSQENIAMIRAYNKVIDILYKHIGKAESEE